MLGRALIGMLVAALVFLVPAATADEPLGKGLEGTFSIQGTHGYEVEGWIASAGEGTEGSLILFVTGHGGSDVYGAHGQVSKEHASFDLGALGKVEVEVRPTGAQETVRSQCGGRPVTVEGQEYVGTIEFDGEEGFTTAHATSAPLSFEPLLDILCPGLGVSVESGEHLPGVRLKAKRDGHATFELDQNHRGAPVFYAAHVAEKHDGISISRAVTGHLGAGAVSYEPSLESATFSAAGPFSGQGTYRGTRPPHLTRPGRGTWRGTLRVDFAGRRGVPIAGPGFSASIVHARRTETHD